jgi:orotidine-5'-phosphate decarboxylase
MGLKRQKGLIVAIDTIEKKEYDKLKNTLASLSELSEDMVFKPGIPTALTFGFNDFIDVLKQYDNKIIFDAKLAEDTWDKSEQMLKLCKGRKLDGMIVHGFVPKEIIRGLVKNSENTDIIAIAKMSSENLVYDKHYKEIAKTAVDCGAKGIVVGANHPKVIREVRNIVGESAYVCSPGIGYQGGDARTALKSGTDYLIVGRTILKADDPREKAMEYLKLLNT